MKSYYLDQLYVQTHCHLLFPFVFSVRNQFENTRIERLNKSSINPIFSAQMKKMCFCHLFYNQIRFAVICGLIGNLILNIDLYECELISGKWRRSNSVYLSSDKTVQPGQRYHRQKNYHHRYRYAYTISNRFICNMSQELTACNLYCRRMAPKINPTLTRYILQL